jgi:polar amino acid transport system substrate-binding protein
MVFTKGNSLVRCVNDALAKLKSDGMLASLRQRWLGKAAGAPVLK